MPNVNISGSIYEDMKNAGIQIDHHESDLYVKDCDTAREIIQAYKETGRRLSAKPFTACDGSGTWWDIPFSYSPWWEAKCRVV